MNDYDMWHVIGDFEDACYDGGGEANRGGCGGCLPRTYTWIDKSKLKCETEKAILIELNYGNEFIDEWFPKSQISEVMRCEVSGVVYIEFKVPDWLFDRKQSAYNNLIEKCGNIKEAFNEIDHIVDENPQVVWTRCKACNNSTFGIGILPSGKTYAQCIECGLIQDIKFKGIDY